MKAGTLPRWYKFVNSPPDCEPFEIYELKAEDISATHDLLARAYEQYVDVEENPELFLKINPYAPLPEIDRCARSTYTEFGSSILNELAGDDLFMIIDQMSDLDWDFPHPFDGPFVDDEDFVVNALVIARVIYCFWRYLSKYGPWQNIQSRLSVIDFSITKFERAVTEWLIDKGYYFSKSAEKRFALERRIKAKNKKMDKRKQQVMEIYHTIERRSEMRPYALAKIIQKRYVHNGPKGKIPHERTIVRYLKEENVIKPIDK